MNFKTTTLFDKQAKKLGKKYRNIKNDLSSFIKKFEELHLSATTIQKNLYKIRIANSNKNKGVLGIVSITTFNLKRLPTF